MTIPIACLLGFTAWAMLLVGFVGAWRTVLVVTGRVAANGFPSGTPHGSERYWRLNRAHLNAVENLPVIATVVLVGTILGVDTPLFDRLSMFVLGARIVQSLVHIASGSKQAVSVRFSAFAVQVLAVLWMGVEITRVSGGLR
ncbi:MAG: MAPEG family protein [Deltaproteobacteria bacterium]|nr:MAPEG family protein [Deltaproteobacteria bacterium]